jgi:hypothetical protein
LPAGILRRDRPRHDRRHLVLAEFHWFRLRSDTSKLPSPGAMVAINFMQASLTFVVTSDLSERRRERRFQFSADALREQWPQKKTGNVLAYPGSATG